MQPLRGIFPINLKSFHPCALTKVEPEITNVIDVYESHFFWKGADEENNPAIVRIQIDKDSGDPFRIFLTTSLADAVITSDEYGIPTSVTISGERALVRKKLNIDFLDVRADIAEDGRAVNLQRFVNLDMNGTGEWKSVEDPTLPKPSAKQEMFEVVLLGLHLDIYKKDIMLPCMAYIRNR